MLRFEPFIEDGFVGLIFVRISQVAVQHPCEGVEPLQDNENMCSHQIPRMAEADMRRFVRDDRGAVFGIIIFGKHNILHPTERSHARVGMQNQPDIIIQRRVFPFREQSP